MYYYNIMRFVKVVKYRCQLHNPKGKTPSGWKSSFKYSIFSHLDLFNFWKNALFCWYLWPLYIETHGNLIALPPFTTVVNALLGIAGYLYMLSLMLV